MKIRIDAFARKIIETFDGRYEPVRIDPEFAGLWVRFCYGDMYTRGIVDDKTRLLCMVGNCVAVGEGHEGRAHMKGALRKGAKPREILEVILQSCTNFGMPSMLKALKIFVKLMEEDGRAAEIGNPPKISLESLAICLSCLRDKSNAGCSLSWAKT